MDKYMEKMENVPSMSDGQWSLPVGAVLSAMHCVARASDVRHHERNPGFEVPVRVVNDFTASGVNSSFDSWRFRMGGINAAIGRMSSSPSLSLGSVDIRKMFPSLPLGKQMQRVSWLRDPRAETRWQGTGSPPPKWITRQRQQRLRHGRTPPFRRWTGVPLGFKLSPAFACSTSAEIVQFLAAIGITVVSYVDDFLIGSTSRRIRGLNQNVRQPIADLGFRIHPTKGWATPKRRSVFLGLGVDLRRRVFFVPAYKITKLANLCTRTLQHLRAHLNSVLPRWLASLGGIAVSLQLASPAIPSYTRSLWDALKGVNWRPKAPVTVDTQVLRDIRTLAGSARLWTETPFQPPATTATVWTDASTKGYGAWGHTNTATDGALASLSGFWSEKHVSGEINVLELQAVILAPRANHLRLAGRDVRLWTDNRCVMAVVNNHRSRSPTVMVDYRELFQLLEDNNMTLQASWIDTKSNYVADGLSRASDPTEYRIDPTLPQLAMERWDIKLQHDCFAADWAHQPDMTYDSRWGSVDATRVDTMPSPWGRQTEYWWTPPANFIAPTLLKIDTDGARGVLLTPDWPSAPWWPRARSLSSDSICVGDMARYVHRLPNNSATPEPLRNHRWGYRLWRIHGSPSSALAPDCYGRA